jgi:hypothetical protein
MIVDTDRTKRLAEECRCRIATGCRSELRGFYTPHAERGSNEQVGSVELTSERCRLLKRAPRDGGFTSPVLGNAESDQQLTLLSFVSRDVHKTINPNVANRLRRTNVNVHGAQGRSCVNASDPRCHGVMLLA